MKNVKSREKAKSGHGEGLAMNHWICVLFGCQIFLLLGDISAAKRTLKKAFKMHLGVNDADSGRLGDLLKNGLSAFVDEFSTLTSVCYSFAAILQEQLRWPVAPSK